MRSIADSSSVGSRLDDVLAIFVAATPATSPMPLLAAFGLRSEPPVAVEVLDLVATGWLAGFGADTAAGLADPPKNAL